MATSHLTYSGLSSRSHCGYCNKNSSASPRRVSVYMLAKSLSCEDYQALMERGWRRSGTVLYKPHMRETCCPQYTIRLSSATFKPTRDQRHTLHRWTRFVLGDEYIAEAAKKYPLSKAEKKAKKSTFSLSDAVHSCEYASLKSKIPPEPAHKLVVTLEPSSFTEEKYALYWHYQTEVHGDKPSSLSPRSLTRFLCDSPIPASSSPIALGTHHQLYRLDGRLIAIAVLDLTPTAVSSVYFIFHQDYKEYQLGKVSACREALMAEEDGRGWYYMGFYIDGCTKMRYKKDFGPQEILEPNTNAWRKLKDVEGMLGNRWLGEEEEGEKEDVKMPDIDSDSEDEDQEPPSLFTPRMPGILSAPDLASFDFASLKISIGNRPPLNASHVVGFDNPESTARKVFQELVAVVGKEVAGRAVFVF